MKPGDATGKGLDALKIRKWASRKGICGGLGMPAMMDVVGQIGERSVGKNLVTQKGKSSIAVADKMRV